MRERGHPGRSAAWAAVVAIAAVAAPAAAAAAGDGSFSALIQTARDALVTPGGVAGTAAALLALIMLISLATGSKADAVAAPARPGVTPTRRAADVGHAKATLALDAKRQEPVGPARRRLDPPAAPAKVSAASSGDKSERRKFAAERRLKPGRVASRAAAPARAKAPAERRAVVAKAIKIKLSPEGESAKRRHDAGPPGRQFASSENSSHWGGATE